MTFSPKRSQYMHGGPGPIPIQRAGVTEYVKTAAKAACDSIYKDTPHICQVMAYKYGSLLMYSISASSKFGSSWSEVAFDTMKATFVDSLGSTDPTEVVFGSAQYIAPSSIKFMIIIHT